MSSITLKSVQDIQVMRVAGRLASEVLDFIGTPAYEARKRQRFRATDERVIARNPAFVLADPSRRTTFAGEYARTAALYYQGQPPFEDIVARIHEHIDRM
jgi:hypothetical protein